LKGGQASFEVEVFEERFPLIEEGGFAVEGEEGTPVVEAPAAVWWPAH